MSFSGAQNRPRKAVKWLSKKFKSPHLLLPKVYQEIKDIVPARSKTEVACVAESLLRQVESISALMNDNGNSFPKAVLPLLQDDRGISISVMRECIADRFEVYQMIASALGPALNLNFRRHLLALNPPTSPLTPLPSRTPRNPGVRRKDEVEALDGRSKVGDSRTLLSMALRGGRMAWSSTQLFVNIAQQRKDP